MRIWEKEVIYDDGEKFFSDILSAIAGARQSVDLETYIFDQDDLGQRILNALGAAALRGVKVRLLLDGYGCSQWSLSDLKPLRKAGVRARFYHPLPWQNPSYRFLKFISPRRIALGLWKLNRRNHRKSCVVDGHKAFLGGMNISSRHLRSSAGEDAWRDTSVCVEGDLSQLALAFDHAWTHTRSALPRIQMRKRFDGAGGLLHVNVTRKQRKKNHQDLVSRVIQAQKRIWITTPYFVPDLSLLLALRLAARSGTDVRILLPFKNDVWGMKWAIGAFYFPLLTVGARIFEYKPSVLHAKVTLIDQWASVGSSNLNHRSFFHDLETDVILKLSPNIERIAGRFLKDLEVSEELRLHEWNRRSWIPRMLEGVSSLFRRWL